MYHYKSLSNCFKKKSVFDFSGTNKPHIYGKKNMMKVKLKLIYQNVIFGIYYVKKKYKTKNVSKL